NRSEAVRPVPDIRINIITDSRRRVRKQRKGIISADTNGVCWQWRLCLYIDLSYTICRIPENICDGQGNRNQCSLLIAIEYIRRNGHESDLTVIRACVIHFRGIEGIGLQTGRVDKDRGNLAKR